MYFLQANPGTRRAKALAFMDKKCAISHKLGVVPGILRYTEGLSWHTVDLRKLFTILFGSILLITRTKPMLWRILLENETVYRMMIQ